MVKVFEKFFSRLLDQMLSIWFNFTFNGNGLIMQKKDGVEMRSICHCPIMGSSYLALPSALQNLNCLLNIKLDEKMLFTLFHNYLALQTRTVSMKKKPGVCALALTYISLRIYCLVDRWGFCNAYGVQRDSRIRKTKQNTSECFHVPKQLVDSSSRLKKRKKRSSDPWDWLYISLTGYYFSIQFGEFRFLLFGIVFLSKTSQYLNLCFSGMMLIYFTLESIYFVWHATDSSSRDFRIFFCDQRFDFKNYPWGSSFSWISANFVYSVLFCLDQCHVRCHVLAFM